MPRFSPIDLTVWVHFFGLSHDEGLASLQVHMSFSFSSDAFQPIIFYVSIYSATPLKPAQCQDVIRGGIYADHKVGVCRL